MHTCAVSALRTLEAIAPHARLHSPTLGLIPFDRVITEIAAFIRTDPHAPYTLMIGTDSEHRGRVEFISAIVIYRERRGARFFWTSSVHRPFATLRDRIFEEATRSIALAQHVLDALHAHAGLAPDTEIHVDIGTHGPTHDLIREVCGYVRGCGFDVRIKPDAAAASQVADRYAWRRTPPP